MPELKIGQETIKFEIEVNNQLKHHYLRLKSNNTILIRGRKLSDNEAKLIILKKAKWILKKLPLVKDAEPVVYKNGMVIPFMGKLIQMNVKFGTLVNPTGNLQDQTVTFTIPTSFEANLEQVFPHLIENFYRHQASLIIPERLKYWSNKTQLAYRGLKFRKFKRKWGSCSNKDLITINIFALKLSEELIDYLLVHELCHVKVKNHGAAFWKEVAQIMPHYKELDKVIRHTQV